MTIPEDTVSESETTDIGSLTKSAGERSVVAITLTGVAKDAVNLGTFTGSTITDNVVLKVALQELETEVETKLAAETITLATFKSVVAASSDFADFQTRVAAL